MQNNVNLIKGLDDDYIQIIGIEFTIRQPDGRRQELAMFSPQGLIIPRQHSRSYGYGFYRPAITFHSTDGDFTMEDFNGQCPW